MQDQPGVEHDHTDSGFFTPLNQLNIRTEYGVALLLTTALTIVHFREINWLVFALAFLYIDLIGYLPGLARVLITKNGYIEKPFYYAYNITHSFVTALPIAAAGWLIIDAKWSLLAIFIHLFGDRALLGNYTKALDGPFEHYTARSAAPTVDERHGAKAGLS